MYWLKFIIYFAIFLCLIRLVFWYKKRRKDKWILRKEPIFSDELMKKKSQPFVLTGNGFSGLSPVDQSSMVLDVARDATFAKQNKEPKCFDDHIDENINVDINAPELKGEIPSEIMQISINQISINNDKNIDEFKAVTKPLKDIVCFTLMAKKGREYTGYELLQSLLSAGLRYGEMDIFHRYEKSECGDVLFSVAQAVSPGTFELNNVGEISCPGLAFFMELRNNKTDATSFDCMVETARQLSDDLGGDIYDDEKHLLTNEAIESLRACIISAISN